MGLELIRVFPAEAKYFPFALVASLLCCFLLGHVQWVDFIFCIVLALGLLGSGVSGLSGWAWWPLRDGPGGPLTALDRSLKEELQSLPVLGTSLSSALSSSCSGSDILAA